VVRKLLHYEKPAPRRPTRAFIMLRCPAQRVNGAALTLGTEKLVPAPAARSSRTRWGAPASYGVGSEP
jgi:hypothetical protein